MVALKVDSGYKLQALGNFEELFNESKMVYFTPLTILFLNHYVPLLKLLGPPKFKIANVQLCATLSFHLILCLSK